MNSKSVKAADKDKDTININANIFCFFVKSGRQDQIERQIEVYFLVRYNLHWNFKIDHIWNVAVIVDVNCAPMILKS